MSVAAVSEWLRSLIRNQMGSARVGSNPARCDTKRTILQSEIRDFSGCAAVSEWLRSLTRNQMGSARVGNQKVQFDVGDSTRAVVSEWLRSLTRNQMGSARVGSNPARCVSYFFLPVGEATLTIRL
uniref:Uncharacterized protein n=1 Tax=Setaria digitata TaxID=48799 RepID=A0A915Q210_9BILA